MRRRGSALSARSPDCWLAQFSSVPCEGRLRAVHLVPKQKLRQVGADPWDERAYVPACGGYTGLEGHHGQFDSTPHDRTRLVVPREALPGPVEALCAEVGLGWWLDEKYGLRVPA